MNSNISSPSWFAPLMLLVLILGLSPARSLGQTGTTNSPANPTTSPSPKPATRHSLEKDFFKNILRDQRAIITSPFHMHSGDALYLVPFGIATAGLIATDHRTASALDNDQNRLNISRDISLIGEGYTTGGIAAAFYFAGRATHNERAREAGLLGAEALMDSGIDVEAIKLITQRERPTADNSRGRFFTSGNDFPSGHAISAWSLATVVAEEYHRPIVSFSAYGLATAVSVSRYTGRNHFLSDILVGSVMGYGIGHYVYRKHHDPGLDSPDGTADYKEPRKLFPTIVPTYRASAHLYAMTLSWRL